MKLQVLKYILYQQPNQCTPLTKSDNNYQNSNKSIDSSNFYLFYIQFIFICFSIILLLFTTTNLFFIQLTRKSQETKYYKPFLIPSLCSLSKCLYF